MYIALLRNEYTFKLYQTFGDELKLSQRIVLEHTLIDQLCTREILWTKNHTVL